MIRKYLMLAVLAVLAVSILIPLSPNNAQDASDEGLRVTTTIPVMADIVRNVAGGRAVVESLLRPGVNQRAYELKPADAEKILNSHLFFYVGYGREAVLGSYAERIKGNLGVVRILDEVLGPVTSQASGSPNPYFWLDPNKVEEFVRKLAAILAGLDPQGSEEYYLNANKYIEELRRLDGWIRSRLEKVPPWNRKIVSVRNTLQYFAERYGLEVIGYTTNFAGAYEPQTKAMVELLERVVAKGAPAIFIEYEEAATTLREAIETLAEEAGVDVVEFVYIESLAPEHGVRTYLEMMRRNTEVIVTGLSKASKNASPNATNKFEYSIFDHPLLRPFKYEFMRRGVATLIFVMIAASLVGAFAVLKGWAIFGDALSHGAIIGLVAAYLLGIDFFLGALTAGLAVALAVSSVERRTKLRTDVVIAVTFTSMLALAIAVISYIGGAALSIEDILFADVTAVSADTMVRTLLLSFTVIVFTLLLRRVLLLYTIDPLSATALGMRVRAVHYGLLLLLALTIISAFMTIGAIPAIASLIIPPAAAFLISKRPSGFITKSIAIAIFSAIAGVYVSYYVGVNTGAAAVLISALVFTASVLYRSLRRGPVL